MDHYRPVVLLFPHKTLRGLSRGKEAPAAPEEGGRGREEPPRDVSHNEVERRRKLKISQSIKELSDILQAASCSCGKQTRGEVLEKVVERIKTLQEDNDKIKSDIATLPQPGSEGELFVKLADLLVEHLLLRVQLQRYYEERQAPQEERTEQTPPPHCSTAVAAPTSTQANTETVQHWSVTSLLSCDQQHTSHVQESCDQQHTSHDQERTYPTSCDIPSSSDSCHGDMYTDRRLGHTHQTQTTDAHSVPSQHQPSGVIVQPWVGGSPAHLTRPWNQSEVPSHHSSTRRGRDSREIQEWPYPHPARHSEVRGHHSKVPHPLPRGFPPPPTADPTPGLMYYHSSRPAQSHGGHMMVCDVATPPYPLAPPSAVHHHHPTVWRPYSEPARSSGGFCLSDILSLSPHEVTDTQGALQLEPTQSTANKIPSFLVDRLLDDM